MARAADNTAPDVDIQITRCGICGSDLTILKSRWGPTIYPYCVGHEIVGKAIGVGQNVKHVGIGDRVGVGAQALSCLKPDCPCCSTGRENYCPGFVTLHLRLPRPMLRGGATVFAPLNQNGCGPGKTVGIVGIGGLGHFDVLFAKALGAERVIAVSRKASKRGEALTLGVDEYIATDDDKDWAIYNMRRVDLIMNTVSSVRMPLVDNPDGGQLPTVNALPLIVNNIKVGISCIASPSDINEMLKLASEKELNPLIET
ncbi:zinc-binding dehydrogenase [Nemania abortiva]|nr:zinc-binding dehydrogenase [Nemania abortiva]